MLTNRDFKLALIGVIFTLAALAVFFLIISCEPENDGCEPEETRCEGPTLQICNADQNWQAVMSCLDLEPGEWACCASKGEIGCWKVEECDG